MTAATHYANSSSAAVSLDSFISLHSDEQCNLSLSRSNCETLLDETGKFLAVSTLVSFARWQRLLSGIKRAGLRNDAG